MDSSFRRFSYRRGWIKIYFALVLVAWLVGLIVLPTWTKAAGWSSLDITFSIPGFLLLVLLFANFYLSTSDIAVSEHGISWMIMNVKWRTVEWTKIDRIRISCMRAARLSKSKVLYHIHSDRRRHLYFMPKGGIFFDDSIVDVDDLKNVLRLQVLRRKIPVEDKLCASLRGTGLL